MNSRLLDLATRHGALKARIDAQRLRLAQDAEPLARVLAGADKACAGVDWLKQHPAVVGAGVAVLVVARPKRAWRWATRAWVAWRGWTSLKNSLEKVG
jgi:hypothetical protein